MNQTKKILLFIGFLAVFFLPEISRASVFDAADFLAHRNAAVSALGELILTNPTSEGVEIHGRYGLSRDWNVGAMLGAGSANKQFRLGAEAVYNFFPDTREQMGFSLIGSVIFLDRHSKMGLQLRLGPMAHRKYVLFDDLPAEAYLALPFYYETRGTGSSFGSQFVLGSLLEFTRDHHWYVDGEVAARITKAESYLLVGAGYRFDD